MKSILVPTGGSATDQVVFETALAVAKPLGAHLVFLHIRMQAGQAAPHTPHVAFARGAALTNALDELTKQGETRATAAKENVLAFCRASQIELRDTLRDDRGYSTMAYGRRRASATPGIPRPPQRLDSHGPSQKIGRSST